MEQEEIGTFIAQLRKDCGLTQKALAEKLSVTDKAVSKWERGLCYPDISLLTPLAETLGVSVGELLRGERYTEGPDPQTDVDTALAYGKQSSDDRAQKLHGLAAWCFTAALLLGGIVCAICDQAMNRYLSWAWYPISSVVLAWCVCFPVIRGGRKGILWSLAALTVLIVPFLYVLERLTHCDILPVGVPMAVLGLVLFWGLFAIWRWMGRRKYWAAGWSFVLTAVMCLITNLVLVRLLDTAPVNLWNLIAAIALAAIAAYLFYLDKK